MRTRSNFYPFNSSTTILRRSNRRRIVEPEFRAIENIVSMADRTMEELLQAPTEGYGEAIVIPEILAENFEIKTNLLQLVQANKFHGRENDNPHTHISNFKRMTATLKYKDVPNDAIKLMMFPYSLEDRARIWDVVSKTDDRIDKLADRISNLVEIVNKQVVAPAKAVEKTCVTCGGAHAYYECIATDCNPSSICAASGSYNQISPPNRASHQIPPPGFASVQNNSNRFNQGHGNFFNQANNSNQGNNFRGNNFQNNHGYRAQMNNINVLRGDFSKQEEKLRRNLNDDMRCILGSFFQNQPSTSGNLSSNTIPNPKGEMKAVTTRSGLAYESPSILTESLLEKVDEQNTEEILDKEQSNSSGSTAQVQPPVVPISIPKPDVPRTQSKPTIPYPSRDGELTPTRMTPLELADRSITRPKRVAEDVFVKVGKFHFPTDFVVVEFEADPRVPLILGRSFLRTGRALIDVYGEEITLRVNDESITFNLNQTMRYSSTYDDTSVNRVDVIDIACEDFVQDVLDFQYNLKSSSPTLVSDDLISESDARKVPIVKFSLLTLTPFGESDFFLEEIEDFLNDDSILTGIKKFVYDPEGDILFLENLLNEDLFQLPLMDLKLVEESKEKSSVEEPPELELKELPSHLEYVFLEDSNKLPVIIAKNLTINEKEALINVLNSHKRAIAWKISDIKGIDLRFCTHKILMEDDYKLAIQSQRRVNPKIHDLIKKEFIKLLDAGMIYPISDSPWVSPIHCVPKKGGMTVVANENNDLIPTRLVTGWRVCINYMKLNDATRKDHFSLPFMDQMLERLAGNEFYCFLNGFSGTFQMCMMSIFYDMIEKMMEVFMDNFSVFGDSLSEGIVLGHKISKSGIEVDRAKVDVIAKLSHPTTVKGVRSFLGHAGFYRRFIYDFSKIARPMTHLLEKETPFVFSKECIDAFNTLKKKLTEAPILVVPDWNLPFELMCDARDYAIGAVLGQRKSKHFQPIHYESKTMTEAQIHYTTTEKEMLAVVYVFEKFRPYLVLSKSIVYTDHSALKYLLNKQDAKPRNEMPQNSVQVCEIFDIWGIDFMGLFPSSKGNKYILVAVDYLSKWVEVKALPTNNARVVVKFLKSLFSRFSIPLAIISDRGTHFCNDQFTRVMIKYGVTHRLSTSYHPQTSGQVETAGDHRKLQLNELSELRDQAYENSVIYKERTKKLHDSKIKNRIFNIGDQVLLFNFRLKIFSGKLKTRWSGPFTITRVFPYGTIKLSQPNGPNFKIQQNFPPKAHPTIHPSATLFPAPEPYTTTPQPHSNSPHAPALYPSCQIKAISLDAVDKTGS
nr:DNA-directed DNA polymerase [Tanacetum cinerariifolium]